MIVISTYKRDDITRNWLSVYKLHLSHMNKQMSSDPFFVCYLDENFNLILRNLEIC